MTYRYPNLEAVRDLRISEMTPEQQADATELWLRKNLGWCVGQHGEHVRFLLARLDAERALLRTYMAVVIDAESVSYLDELGPTVKLTDQQRAALRAIELDAREEFKL